MDKSARSLIKCPSSCSCRRSMKLFSACMPRGGVVGGVSPGDSDGEAGDGHGELF